MNASIFRSLEDARGHFGPCALAIGNFDGVHIGHFALIGETVRCAQRQGLTPAVLTFDPHPTAVVAPNRIPALICTLQQRLRLIGAAGVGRIFVLQFTPEVANLSPEEFVSQVLLDALGTRAVFVGENFRFGYRQAGTPELLKTLGQVNGFETHFLKPVTFRRQVVSSTAVRAELTSGKVVRAAQLLGRCFALSGPVVSGRGIGSKKTVPTLNLRPDLELIVPHGIYVTETIELTETLEQATGRSWPSVTSCGYNPTFGAGELTVETYLLGGLSGTSPSRISVHFRHFLRYEQAYPNAEALKAQILKDAARAEVYWKHLENLRKAVPSIY
ncbi:MAG: riboflavin biosynthesis protein RibF [Acidobacteriaceae bacterium]|nr:riboflavin biosynthesis protein RibF [Acidobacteriaceae bacterium]